MMRWTSKRHSINNKTIIVLLVGQPPNHNTHFIVDDYNWGPFERWEKLGRLGLMCLDAYREREQLQEAENWQVDDSQEIVMEW